MIERIKAVAGLVAIACGSPAPAKAEVVALQSVVAGTEAPQGLSALAGEYAFSGGEAERQALRDAIDALVEEMNPLARGIARSRLLESNRIASRVAIGADGNAVTVSFDDRAYTATLGAAAIEVTGIDGKPVQLTHRFQGETLTQRFVGSQGARRNALDLRGTKLRIHVVIESESLPKPLSYRLTYTKR